MSFTEMVPFVYQQHVASKYPYKQVKGELS